MIEPTAKTPHKAVKAKVRQKLHPKVRGKVRQKHRGGAGGLTAEATLSPGLASIPDIAAVAGQEGSAYEQLIAVMTALRRALIAGQIAQIPALSQRLGEVMQHYLDDADSLPDDPAELVALRRAAEVNASCLEATLAGLRSARRRLAEIHRMHHSIGYDRNGRSHMISAPETLARRI